MSRWLLQDSEASVSLTTKSESEKHGQHILHAWVRACAGITTKSGERQEQETLTVAEDIAPRLHAVNRNTDATHFVLRNQFVWNQSERAFVGLLPALQFCASFADDVQIRVCRKAVEPPWLVFTNPCDT